jgi:DNA polymerase elongation subunit (family B)
MSEFYTDVRLKGAKVLVSGYSDGVRFRDEIPYSPSLYVSSSKEEEFKTIYGQNVAKLSFESPYDAKQHIKQYDKVTNFQVYGNAKFDNAYIAETYTAKKVDYDIESIDYSILDIETTTEHGKVDVFNTPEEITLITLISKKHGTITFGSRPYSGKYKGTYQYCENEASLLKRFLEYWTYHMPDVITGWNTEFFDLPYIVGRITHTLGAQYIKMLSPWKMVILKESFVNNKPALSVDIYGVQQLDYLALYRKFRLIPRENYKLDTIAFCEVKANKLKNPHKTFKEFYEKDWELFVDYNVRDCELVGALEDKLKLIEVALTVAYSAHTNYGDVFSPVRVWESIINHSLLMRNVIVPYDKSDNESQSYEGAYVKPPVKGLMGWNASFDAKALYPSIAIEWNISPDTLVEERLNITPDTLFGNSYTFDKAYCVTANGTQYRRDTQGFLPALFEEFLNDRDVYKGAMIAAKKALETCTDEETRLQLQKDIAKNRNYEQAIKILLNAAYGALANKHFKFFDIRLAEAITLTGQAVLKCADKGFNVYLAKMGFPEQDFVIYEDTDSCYVDVNPLVQRYCGGKTDDQIVDFIDRVCLDKFGPMLEKVFDNLAEHTHAFKKTIFFKRENIASKGFWKEKKKYVLKVHDSEGVRYAKPEMKVMGLEIVRSSTPEIVRSSLLECVNLILDSDIVELRKYVSGLKKEFYASTPENIAFPRGVSDVDKYMHPKTLYKKGCPIAVRAAILHNHHVMDKKLIGEYPLINSGDKIKFLYLKPQNPLRENVMGFASDFPENIVAKHYVDYKLQWSKTFLDPLNSMLDSIGWELDEVVTLDNFMG